MRLNNQNLIFAMNIENLKKVKCYIFLKNIKSFYCVQ